jgi:enediyne biosynthesis protein E4
VLDLFAVNYCVWIPEKEPACIIGKARTYCHPKYYEGLPNQLYRNNSDGSFSDVSVASGIAAHIGKGMAVAFLDFNQDGRLDAFVTNDTFRISCFAMKETGVFGRSGSKPGWPSAMTAGQSARWVWTLATSTTTAGRTSS